jgi:hypothetical protein
MSRKISYFSNFLRSGAEAAAVRLSHYDQDEISALLFGPVFAQNWAKRPRFCCKTGFFKGVLFTTLTIDRF